MKKERIIWIELLRIAACIGVIGLHAGSQHFRDIPLDTVTWKVSNFYHGITRFAVACFIMISGALYLDKKRSWDLKKLWLRNILPIAVTYLFWQVFYAVYRIMIAGKPGLGTPDFFKKTMVYVSESYFHLWYLPMLIGLLILTPLIWEIVNSARGKQWAEYMIVLFLVFQILSYTVLLFDLPWKEHMRSLIYTVKPELITSFVGYFILGHYLYEYGLPKKLENLVYILGLIFILGGIWLCQIKSLETGKATQDFYSNYSLAAFFWSSAVFLFFKNYMSGINWKEKTQSFICSLSGCTFGIYLVHAFVRDVLHRKGFDSMMIDNTMLAIPVVIALIFLISWAIIYFLRKIPFVRKWIV